MLLRLLPFVLLAAPVGAQTWTRSATPFPVRDAAGEPIPLPFTGGLFEPRPALLDLDGDAERDLVLTVGGAGLQWFENTAGPGEAPRWTWRTDRLGDLEPGNWFAFADLDLDGTLDVLTRGAPGRVRFWRGVGQPGAPAFALAADGLTDTAGAPVAVEDSSIPDLGDVDGDGRPDLLAGRADLGMVTLYRHEGVENGLPRFALVSTEYQGLQVYEPNPSCNPRTGEPAPGPPVDGQLVPTPRGPSGPTIKHGANAIALHDVTGDGAPELFWGDFFTPSLILFANQGTPTAPAFVRASDRYPPGQPLTSGGYNAPAFGDADGDGDADLAVGVQRGLCFDSQSAVDNLFYFANAGTPAAPDFQLVTSRLVPTLDVGTRATVALADLDADGDLDLVVGNETNVATLEQATLAYFVNEGTSTAPAFRLADADWLGLRYDFGGYAPAFADLDADGDLDLLVGGFNGRLAFLRNTGTPQSPQFALESDRFESIDAGQYGRVAAGDLDGDGRLDLMTGASNGRVGVYRNVGTPQLPVFVTEPNGTATAADLAWAASVGLPDDVGEDSAPAIADVDGDGRLDVLVGSAVGAVRVFVNEGSATAPQFVERDAVVAGRRRTTPAAADLDGDGLADLLAGSDAGGLLFWGTGGQTGASPDPAPPSRLGLRLRPNPTDGVVTVAVNAPTTGRVDVFDAAGRRVAQLALAGREATWRAGAPGVYLVRVTADGTSETAALTVGR